VRKTSSGTLCAGGGGGAETTVQRHGATREKGKGEREANNVPPDPPSPNEPRLLFKAHDCSAPRQRSLSPASLLPQPAQCHLLADAQTLVVLRLERELL
jgi:hypothetical protein